MAPLNLWSLGALLQVILTIASDQSLADSTGDSVRTAVLLPGGVTDASGEIGFVDGAKGGIDALDLNQGRLLWNCKEAAHPLLVAGGRLVAEAEPSGRANRIRIAVLSIAEKGKVLLQSDPVDFPEWVSVQAATGRSFSCEVVLDKESLYLKWQANAWYAGGAAAPPQIVQLAKKEAAGVTRINLDNGRVQMLSSEEAPAFLAAPLPKQLQSITSQSYWDGVTWQTKPWIAGRTVAALDHQDADGEQKTLLKTWDLKTGKEGLSVDLRQGKSLVAEVTLNKRHILLREGDKMEYSSWWVYDCPSGKLEAELPYVPNSEATTVVGGRLYCAVAKPANKPATQGFIQERTLKAIDLKSGKALWEWPLEGRQVSPPRP